MRPSRIQAGVTARGRAARVGLSLVVGSILVASLAVGGFSCGGDAEAGVVTVVMAGLTFTPSEITIAPGTKVRWVNEDQTAHTSTADGWSMETDDPLAWNSFPMNPGDEFERTFDAVGVFDYFCMVHPYMTGAVTVEEPGGPPPTRPTTTTEAPTTTSGS